MNKDNPPIIKNNLFILKKVWAACPSRVVMTFVMSLLSFASWTFYTVFFMRYLFDAPEGARSFRELMIFIWAVVAVNLGYHYLESWYTNTFLPLTDIRIQSAMSKMLFEKSQSVDISCYETTEFYDSYTRAAAEANDRALSILKNCATLLSSLLSSAYVIYTMASITLYSLPFIIFPLIANIYLGKKFSRVLYEIDKANVPYRRRQEYINRVVYLRKYTGEIRLTNVFEVLKEIYNQSVQGIVDTTRMFANRRFSLEITMQILSFPLAFQGMWIVGAYLAIEAKSISLAEFIVLSGAIVSVTWMTRGFRDALVESFANANYVEGLQFFLDYEPRIDENQTGRIPEREIESIVFRNVSFRYSGQNSYALRNVNLVLEHGTKNALVGVNGSGKSTFVKLVMRLYDPTEGEILLNGVDIREYDIRAYRNLIGSVFQDFALFSESVLENVLLRREDGPEDRAAVIQALKDSDIYEKVRSLKKKEDTILTREFDPDGAELSGGEKQKIAIARAFVKKRPILILDEPSSALDPVAEYTMYESIIRLCDEERDGKISLIVSHRLSSAALCDKIFLFEGGAVVEAGAHAELMAAQGAYANMFRKQAESYLQIVEV